MSKPAIITHRGLQPTRPDFYQESTLEAFQDHIQQGFSIEVDLNFTRDAIILFHDTTLQRRSAGQDLRAVQTLSLADFKHKKFGTIATLEELLDVFASYITAHPHSTNFIALHFKGKMQTPENIEKLLHHLEMQRSLFPRLLLFDLLPPHAKHIQRRFAELPLGASVAAESDIHRYQSAVGGTLLSIDSFTALGDLYAWAWLDEWDRTAVDKHGNHTQKKFYTPETFSKLQNYALAVVSPELHATSPCLLGGENHPDGIESNKLCSRLAEIVSLAPDAICTDYPAELQQLIQLTKIGASEIKCIF